MCRPCSQDLPFAPPVDNVPISGDAPGPAGPGSGVAGSAVGLEAALEDLNAEVNDNTMFHAMNASRPTRGCLLLLALTAAHASSIGLAAEGTSLQKVAGWGELVDAGGQCKVRTDGARVTLEVPAGSYDLYPDGQKVNAPRLLQDASGDFTVQVKVVGHVMGEKGAEAPGRDVAFNAATLVIWQDENNFVRLDRAGFHKAGRPNHQTYYHVYRDGARTVHQFRPLAVQDTWLRLQRQGGKVTAAWSQDGKSWQTYAAEDVKLADKVKVGVAALSASSAPFAASFEDLSLTPLAAAGRH